MLAHQLPNPILTEVGTQAKADKHLSTIKHKVLVLLAVTQHNIRLYPHPFQ